MADAKGGYVRAIADQATPLTEIDLRNLHRLVVLRSYPTIAGRYADQGRYGLTDTGRHAFPSPAEVPALMGDFANWLGALRIRRRPRSRHIVGCWTCIPATTAMVARRGC